MEACAPQLENSFCLQTEKGGVKQPKPCKSNQAIKTKIGKYERMSCENNSLKQIYSKISQIYIPVGNEETRAL